MLARNACYRVAASIKLETRGEVKECYFRERSKAIELQTVYQRVGCRAQDECWGAEKL
jgi:hypothetical protein